MGAPATDKVRNVVLVGQGGVGGEQLGLREVRHRHAGAPYSRRLSRKSPGPVRRPFRHIPKGPATCKVREYTP